MRTNTPCPAITSSYLTLPFPVPYRLSASASTSASASISVTQIEIKPTKLGKLTHFVAFLFSSFRRTVIESSEIAEHSEHLPDPEATPTLPPEPTPATPFSPTSTIYTDSSEHHYFSEYKSCSQQECDSFSSDSDELPTAYCSLKVISSPDIFSSYRRIFHYGSSPCFSSCCASVSTSGLDEHMQEPCESHYGQTLKDVRETLDCNRTSVGNFERSVESLEFNGTQADQNRSTSSSGKWLLPGDFTLDRSVKDSYEAFSRSCQIEVTDVTEITEVTDVTELTCKPSRKPKLLSDSDLRALEAFDKCMNHFVESVRCNQGGKESFSESLRSFEDDYLTYWEHLTFCQREQLLFLMKLHFNEPHSLNLGSFEVNTTVLTFLDLASKGAKLTLVAVFAAATTIVADYAVESRSSEHESKDQQQGVEIEKLQEVKTIETSNEEPVETEEASREEPQEKPSEEPAKAPNEEPVKVPEVEPQETLNEGSKEEPQETSTEQPQKPLTKSPQETSLIQPQGAATEQNQEISIEEEQKASTEELVEKEKPKREAEKRKKKYQKKRERLRERKKFAKEAEEASVRDELSQKASLKELIEESTEEPQEPPNEELAQESQKASKEESKDESNQRPREVSKAETQEAPKVEPQEAPQEHLKAASDEDQRSKREAEKRHLKSQKKNKKMREKRKLLRLQAKKEVQGVSEKNSEKESNSYSFPENNSLEIVK